MRTPRWYRVFLLALVIMLALGTIATVHAAEFIEEGSLPAGEVIDDDLFIGGERVVVDGTVNGNLFAAGNEVIVNGTVKGSLFAAGQSLIVNGQVEGSVYGGASTLAVGSAATVGRNLVFGGYSLDVSRGSVVERDLLVAGYQATLAGDVGRDVRAALGAVELSGGVGRDVKVEVGSPSEDGSIPRVYSPPGTTRALAPGLRIMKEASIGGQLTYTSDQEQAQAIEAAPESGVVYKTPAPGTRAQIGVQRDSKTLVRRVWRWFLARAREFLSLLVLGALALWLLPDLLEGTAARAEVEPLPSLGWGLVTWIGGYVGAGVAAVIVVLVGIFLGVITLGGLASAVLGIGFSSLGLAFTLFVLLVSYGSKLVTALMVGRRIISGLSPKANITTVGAGLLGIVLYVALRAIPILGVLVSIVVTCMGLGAMALRYRDWRAGGRPVPDADVVPA